MTASSKLNLVKVNACPLPHIVIWTWLTPSFYIFQTYYFSHMHGAEKTHRYRVMRITGSPFHHHGDTKGPTYRMCHLEGMSLFPLSFYSIHVPPSSLFLSVIPCQSASGMYSLLGQRGNVTEHTSHPRCFRDYIWEFQKPIEAFMNVWGKTTVYLFCISLLYLFAENHSCDSKFSKVMENYGVPICCIYMQLPLHSL